MAIMHESMVPKFLGILLLSWLTGSPARASCSDRGIESTVYCSDLIVRARVLDPPTNETQASCDDVLGATLLLKVESYFIGAGPAEIRITRFPTWMDPNGHCHYTSIAVVGEDSRPSIRVGDELVAFLRKNGDQFELLNKCHASLQVQDDKNSGDRAVWVPLQKKEYMRGTALDEYKKTESRLKSTEPEEVHQAGLRLKQAFYDKVALDHLSETIQMVLAGEGGPRSSTAICY